MKSDRKNVAKNEAFDQIFFIKVFYAILKVRYKNFNVKDDLYQNFMQIFLRLQSLSETLKFGD